MALGYAAIALAVLAIFLPLVMVARVRRQSNNNDYYQVMGGTPALAITGVVGILIVGAQLLITVGVLPSLG
jgi:tyrosine-specific transport protein